MARSSPLYVQQRLRDASPLYMCQQIGQILTDTPFVMNNAATLVRRDAFDIGLRELVTSEPYSPRRHATGAFILG